MGVDGVVLAAGYSSRTGLHKMLLKFGKSTIIEKCIEGMYDVCSQIIVVGGYRIEEISCVLSQYPRVKIVFNPDFKEGMFSSVKAGLRYVNEQRFFLTPGDYPLIGSSVYSDMLLIDDDIVVPVYKGFKGHPVLIKSCLIKEILNENGHSNLKEFINNMGYSTIGVDDPGILTDVDTMEDYYKVVKTINGNNVIY